MNCFECEIFYSSYLESELDNSLQTRVRHHLDDCPDCRKALGDIETSLQALRSLPPVSVPGSFSDQVAAAARTAMSAPEAPAAAATDLVFAEPTGVLGRAMVRLRRSPRLLRAAAAVLLVLTGLVLGRLTAEADSLETQLQQRGLHEFYGAWIPSVWASHIEHGNVLMNGHWRGKEAAVATILAAEGMIEYQGRWIPKEEKKRWEEGLLPHDDVWMTADELAYSRLAAKGLVRVGESWLTKAEKARREQDAAMAQKGYVRVGPKWLSPDKYAEKLFAANGLVHAGERWVPKDDAEAEAKGLVKVDGKWMSQDKALREWGLEGGIVEPEPRDIQPPVLVFSPPKSEDDKAGVWRAIPGARIASGRISRSAKRAWLRKSRAETRRLRMGRKGAGRNNARTFEAGGFKGWRLATSTYGTPAFAGGLVFASGLGNHVFAYDGDTGKRVWRVKLGDSGPSSPAVDEDQVYFSTGSCTLYALSAKTGKVRWKKWLAGALTEMPIPAGDLVLQPFSYGSYRLSAFDARTGEHKWDSVLPTRVMAAPVVYGNNVYLTTTQGSLHRIDLNTGKMVWQGNAYALSPPTLHGGRLYVRRVLRHERSGILGEALTVLDVESRKAVKLTLGEPRRLSTKRFKSLAPLEEGRSAAVTMPALSPPRISGDHVIVTRGEALEAVNVNSGKVAWRVTLRRPYNQDDDNGDDNAAVSTTSAFTHSDPCVVGDRIIVGDLSGRLLCVDAQSGKRLWKVNLKSPIGNALTIGIRGRTMPIVAAGRVFLITQKGELISFDTGDPTLDGPHMWGGPLAGRPANGPVASLDVPQLRRN